MTLITDTLALQIGVVADRTQPSLVVRGRADYANIASIISAIEQFIGECDRCISLDLSGVDGIDTAAVEGLASAASRFRQQDKRLRLTGASASVRNLLDRLLLTELFCTQPECAGQHSLDDACISPKAWEIDVFSLPCSMAHCQEARRRVDKVAASVGFGKPHRCDIMLAVGEAVANAIRHGAPEGGESQFTVSCIATPEKLCVSVSDSGSGFSPDDLPSVHQAAMMESGRGVHCINAAMDDVSFHFEAGTTVRMVKLGP